MASVFAVTFDTAAGERLESLCNLYGHRLRVVSSLEKAREWIEMQSFDLLLVDGRYSGSVALTLLEEGWDRHPLMIGGLFHFDGLVEDQWNARLAGARVFSGADGFDRLKRLMGRLLERFDAGGSYGILLVEDLDSPRDIICSYIESLGYSNVQGVSSVDEALAAVEANPNLYCSILTDINMPNRSGLDLIKALRHGETTLHIPVIVLTAYATAENLVECVKAGATGFLVKPPRKRALKSEIEKCRRIFINRLSPRICRPEEAHLLEEAIEMRTS